MVARYSKSRQKACQACVETKSKCDRNTVACGRCTLRQLICIYPNSQMQNCVLRSSSETNGSETWPREKVTSGEEVSPDSLISDLFSETSTTHAPGPSVYPTSSSRDGGQFNVSTEPTERTSVSYGVLDAGTDGFEVSNLDLVCPIDAENIRNRWLNSYVPIPGQVSKSFPSNVAVFVYNILKSYAAGAIRGRGLPPFLHPMQISGNGLCPALSTCLSLIRICESPLPGSENVVVEVLRREMAHIHSELGNRDGLGLLAIFQAYLLYCMVLYFQLGAHSDSFLRQDIMNLQEIACFCSQKGIVCKAEQEGTRPKWEAWILAESKRRTLYVMYLFDNVLSIKDSLPTFLATEVRGLPASASKVLWDARARNIWETAYNVHLADWTDGNFRIDELWPMTEATDMARSRRHNRLERWLETVDELGTMMYAVTSCIHGE